MKLLRLLLAIPLVLTASPAAATEIPKPPPSCDRDIIINPVWKAEGTVSPHEAGFTWFGFTVRADGCILSGATVAYRTIHLSTDDDDLDLEYGTLTWYPGDMAARTVYIRVTKDHDVEPDERFVVKVVCPGSTGISGGTHAIGTVLNDDGDTPSFEPVPYHYHCRQ